MSFCGSVDLVYSYSNKPERNYFVSLVTLYLILNNRLNVIMMVLELLCLYIFTKNKK